MDHSSGVEIPESAVRALSKKLKHYIDVQRREEGFDSSAPNNLMGHFRSGKGTAGTFHYNSLQDRHLQQYFQQPLVRKHLVDLGVVHPGRMQSKCEGQGRMAKSARQQQRLSAKTESERLLSTAAKLLLTSGYCSYNKPPSNQDHYSSEESTSSKARKRSLSSVSSYTKSQSRTPQASTSSHQTSNSSRPMTSLQMNRDTSTCAISVVPDEEASNRSCTCHYSCRVHSQLTDIYPPTKTAEATVNQSPAVLTSSIAHTTSAAAPPVVMCNVSVSTVSSTEASTQTPVEASTQTDLSKMLESSLKLRKKGKRRKTKTSSDQQLDSQSSVS